MKVNELPEWWSDAEYMQKRGFLADESHVSMNELIIDYIGDPVSEDVYIDGLDTQELAHLFCRLTE